MSTVTDTYIILKYGSLQGAYDYWQENVDVSKPAEHLEHELTQFFQTVDIDVRHKLYYEHLRTNLPSELDFKVALKYD